MPSSKWRKKPVEIEAWQITPATAEEIAAWCGGDCYQRFFMGKPETKIIEIPTLEGTIEGREGDWIIKGVAGEFYPCKGEIFEATYEAV